ncbi:MAG: hypothetical protein ACOCUU_03760 [Nanoarchaeota archaeon]
MPKTIDNCLTRNTQDPKFSNKYPVSKNTTRDHLKNYFQLIYFCHHNLSEEEKNKLGKKLKTELPFFNRDLQIVKLVEQGTTSSERETLYDIIKPNSQGIQKHYYSEQLDWLKQESVCFAGESGEPQKRILDRHPEIIAKESSKYRLWFALTHGHFFDIETTNAKQIECLRKFEKKVEEYVPGYRLKPNHLHFSYN